MKFDGDLGRRRGGRRGGGSSSRLGHGGEADVEEVDGVEGKEVVQEEGSRRRGSRKIEGSESGRTGR